MSRGLPDFYVALNVSPDATPEEIKAAYRKQAVRFHPDVSDEPSCAEKFAQISEAYATLSNPRLRAAYDLQRASPSTSGAGASPFTTHIDPFGELLRRQRAWQRQGSRRQTAWEETDEERRQRAADWEAEKVEAAMYKARSRHMSSRLQQARTARILRALQSQWPSHPGVTRHDILAGSLFVSGLLAVALFWCTDSSPTLTQPPPET